MAAVIRIVVNFLLNILQILYQSKSASPLPTHPNVMVIAVSSYLLYCFGFYLKRHISSTFPFSTWPALVIYTNVMRFLGFVSMASLASIIFSTSSTSLVVIYLLLALLFAGKSVLSWIRNRYIFQMRRSNSYSNLQVHVDVPGIHAFSSDVHTLPV